MKQKWDPKAGDAQPLFSVLFRDLFPHTSTFYADKTCKCQMQLFPIFSTKREEFIHTCSSYFGKTYKCAVTVFAILPKQILTTKKTKRSRA